jgi:hypothetical protein
MYRTIEATIQPDGTIRFDEYVEIGTQRRVLVTLLDDVTPEVTQSEALQAQRTSATEMSSLLETERFLHRPYGDPEQIERTIQENREAWGE